ncbi:sulfotransferase domain-containing protein [Aureispira]|nr:sulfotransferase domain-containing protein [Aureispira sp.]
MSIKNKLTKIFNFRRKNNDPEQLTRQVLNMGYHPISYNKPQDIFFVGFPKSGNTWLQNLGAGILFGIDSNYLSDKLTQILIPNVHGQKYYKRILDFTCFKSHLLPQPEYKKVVYIVRDGRDSLVSYYHMMKTSGKTTSLEDIVIKGESLFPCKWNEHVRKWKENKYNADILWIRYEDLLSNPLKEMKRFCDFIGIERSEETIKRSIAGNSFKKMQEKEKEFGWHNPNWNKEGKFIRKGKTGEYIKEMNEELIDFFVKESKTELLELGYDLLPSKK